MKGHSINMNYNFYLIIKWDNYNYLIILRACMALIRGVQ